jgi:hypothetical protein
MVPKTRKMPLAATSLIPPRSLLDQPLDTAPYMTQRKVKPENTHVGKNHALKKIIPAKRTISHDVSCESERSKLKLYSLQIYERRSEKRTKNVVHEPGLPLAEGKRRRFPKPETQNDNIQQHRRPLPARGQQELPNRFSLDSLLPRPRDVSIPPQNRLASISLPPRPRPSVEGPKTRTQSYVDANEDLLDSLGRIVLRQNREDFTSHIAHVLSGQEPYDGGWRMNTSIKDRAMNVYQV